MAKGYMISLESGEGGGKTTQSKRLVEKLTELGYDCLATRQPGGTAISDKIRAILLDAANTELSIRAEVLLFFAAIAQAIEEIIGPAMEAGKVVICDRFVDSTVVYQVLTRKSLNHELFMAINAYVCKQYMPDLTVFFDVPAEVGLARSLKRLATHEGQDESRFETIGMEFHRKVNANYQKVYKEAAKSHRNVYQIDATKPEAEVTTEFIEVVIRNLEKHYG